MRTLSHLLHDVTNRGGFGFNKPLLKNTVVEFSNGQEALVTLDYKNSRSTAFTAIDFHMKSPHVLGFKKKNKPPSCLFLLQPQRALPALDIAQESLGPTKKNHQGYSVSSGSRANDYRTYNPGRSSSRQLKYSRKDLIRSMERHQFSYQTPNFQWREKTNPINARTGSSENSRSRRPPLERGSNGGESSSIQRPIPINEEIMGELREVTVQYTNCADPTESMARKQRVLQGEAKGMMAETAAQILGAASLPSDLNTLPDRDLASQCLPQSLDLPIHPAKLPANDPTTVKKKRCRPPLNKTANKAANKSPLRLTGAKSSKRNKELIQLSPRRKNNGDTSSTLGAETAEKTQRKSAKQRLSLPADVAGPSNAREPPQPIKNEDELTLKKLQGLQYTSCKLVSPQSRGSGGLALLWNQTVEIDILAESPNFIDTHIKAEGRKFFATFVYGEPERSKRQEIWSKISDIGQNREDPWWLTGDFNDIIDSSEKQGGVVRPEGSFVDLRTLMSECDLYDLRHTGNFLSWRGKRHDHLVFCRLDRSMSNSGWAEEYPSGRSDYLRFEGSDHRPLVTYFDLQKQKKKGLFRYDRRYRNNKEVTKLVVKHWRANEYEEVDNKISKCRRAILAWSKEKQLNSKQKIALCRNSLELAIVSPESNTELLTKLNEELSIAYKEEEEFWKQRSRQLWLTLGDKNTGFFHAITKGRKAINKFSVFEDEAGKKYYEEDKILGVIVDYYQQLFTKQDSNERDRKETIQEAILPCITEEMNDKLITIPSANEIRLACFSIHADKAPGPDWFSASFFQTNWENIKEQIIQEVQQFFISGELPRNINKTHVRLIPKIRSPQKMADYRPIALCSVYYKIIAKILTKKLHPLLSNIISENQSAFVPQRAISDNVLISHEVLHYLHTSGAKKSCYMAVISDMSKAYDRIEWTFVKLVLERLDFHQRWVTWIMQCMTSVSYSYLLNGFAQRLVTPQRGLRQGDPLSPYIFILCSEVLSGLCKKAQLEKKLTGIKVGKKSPRISHLLFADDTMFFCKSDLQECTALMKILHKYEMASGQKINPQKSAVTFSSKTQREIKERVKSQLGIEKEGGLGKYLGFPELFGRKKKDLFSMIVDRIRQKARSWSSKSLSSAGKVIMLKSVLAAMPTYTMACFKLPNSLYKRIQSALTRFWWDDSMDKKKMCWVSWKNLSKAKGKGGLGFRDLQSFNDALLAKLSWRILTKPECLLAKILLGKYCHTSSFLESKVPASTSHGWRGICVGRDLLKTQLGRLIGNGATTDIWYDSWLSTSSPQKPMGPAPFSSHKLKVSALISPETLDWDIEKIRELLPAYETEILELKLSHLGAADSHAWLPTGLEASKLLICLPPCGVNGGPLMPWILWAIGLARNQKIFKDRISSPMETLVHAISLAREWQSAQEVNPKPSAKVGGQHIQNQEEGETITCNTDAAWQATGKTAGFGWIFSNRAEGTRREGAASSRHIKSPLMAEATAILLAIQQAIALGFTNLAIASDPKQVIEAIRSEQPLKELHGILQDILILSFNFVKISFNFISRRENQDADALAKSSLRNFVAEALFD
ncbi:Endonuclease/exonuclease/phosphatase superfamily [Arabidopsis suecica]|uniref:Endonuclease/exonuclease/phosphatase superfamily n=1 Tax=Arabidopsis suecica TaxID=45249 RepID=A0A8T1XPJ8_ARASU|nr:Endonuclease/exonuclease/phosphatase superfamily [Arabidopsis suecica]